MNQSCRPYFNERNEPCLERSVIVVVDILGYLSMTKKAFKEGKQQSFLMRISDVLRKALKNVNDPSDAKWFTKLYSDNLIIGYRFLGTGKGSFEFPQACLSIGQFQREMAVEGFFIRGGISNGQIHMSEQLIFGDVLEELKQAERVAHYPRIVLLDSAKVLLKERSDIENSNLLEGILWEDDGDGAKFINYLYPLGEKIDDKRKTEILTHKQNIELNLKDYESEERVFQKYKWLANYHNRFCQSIHCYNSESYMIANV